MISRAVPPIPDELVESISERKAVLFAGSGVSKAVLQSKDGPIEQSLPTWGEFLIGLVNRAYRKGFLATSEVKELKQAIASHKLLLAAEAVRDKLGDSEYERALVEIFDNPALMPTKRHKLITEIPFTAILTTNYDRLIEAAYNSRGGYQWPIYTFEAASDIIACLSRGREFILKAHGHIDRKKSITLTERDYRRLIHRQSGYIAALNTIFITKTVLFIGASLNDPDVRLVLEGVNEAFSGRGPEHFALIPRGKMGDAEIRYWREFFGIHLLLYDATEGHPQVEQFLKTLRRKVREHQRRTGTVKQKAQINERGSRGKARHWDGRVLEVKWFPDPEVLNRIKRDFKNKTLRILGYEVSSGDPEINHEINILFDTPRGSLYWSNVNLSIKAKTLNGGDAIGLSAYWKMTKLDNYGTDPDRIWKRKESNGESTRLEAPFGTQLVETISEIAGIEMPPKISSLLEEEQNLTAANVKPAVIIAVQREQWRLRSSMGDKGTLSLHVASVCVHPCTNPWLTELSDQYYALHRKVLHPLCKWKELEIEERNADESRDPSSYLDLLSEFEENYNLRAARGNSGPIAKYHIAVERLRSISTPSINSKMLEEWVPFLKRGAA